MKFFVESYGCTLNQGEGVELHNRLRALGHEPVSSSDEAELVVLNTCTVIESTQLKILKRLENLHRCSKKIIVSGCMAAVQTDDIREIAPDVTILMPRDYYRFEEIIETNYGRIAVEGAPCDKKTTAIIPIAQGCLGNCSYCITKLARGNLRSYEPEKIVEKVRKSLEMGAREILLTAQDSAAYGIDIGLTLRDLLSKIVSIERDFRIRIGMMNPESLQKILDDVLEIWGNEKVYKFFHIPVQSGSDRILTLMRRGYTVDQFKTQLNTIRHVFPELSLSTDVITGFPGETEADHRATVALIKDIEPNILNVTRFSPRPGTIAASMMPRVPSWVSKNRSRELTKLRFDISERNYQSKIGAVEEILITEHGKSGTMIGRTNAYVPVVVKEQIELGMFAKVQIIGAARTHLYGEVIDRRSP